MCVNAWRNVRCKKNVNVRMFFCFWQRSVSEPLVKWPWCGRSTRITCTPWRHWERRTSSSGIRWVHRSGRFPLDGIWNLTIFTFFFLLNFSFISVRIRPLIGFFICFPVAGGSRQGRTRYFGRSRQWVGSQAVLFVPGIADVLDGIAIDQEVKCFFFLHSFAG